MQALPTAMTTPLRAGTHFLDFCNPLRRLRASTLVPRRQTRLTKIFLALRPSVVL